MWSFNFDDLKMLAGRIGLPAAMFIGSAWVVVELGPEPDAWRCQVPTRTQGQILELVANGDMTSEDAVRIGHAFRDNGFLCRPDNRIETARLELRGR